MTNSYSYTEYDKDNMARALGRALPISFKQSVEICNYIRNKNLNYAKQVLGKSIRQEAAIPFRRFTGDMGHKRKIASGRYPQKASKEILDLISSAEANAQFKGLNTANLVITRINANKASKVTRFGRKRGRIAKRTNIEVVVQEKKELKKDIKSVHKKPKEDVKEIIAKTQNKND
jgi:large subunit ribosomal protein L22